MCDDHPEDLSPKTVGELRAVLAAYADDVRVVVDGYEAGYSDVRVKASVLNLGDYQAYEGEHSRHHEWDNPGGGTPCLVLSRDGWGCQMLDGSVLGREDNGQRALINSLPKREQS